MSLRDVQHSEMLGRGSLLPVCFSLFQLGKKKSRVPQSFQAEECSGISTKRVHLEKPMNNYEKTQLRVEEDLKDVCIIAHIYQLRRRLPSEGSVVLVSTGREKSVSFSLKLT